MRKHRKKHRFFWFVIKLQIFLMILVVGAVGYFYFSGYEAQVSALKQQAVAIVSETNDKTFVPSQTSRVYDSKGMLISERNGEKESTYAPYEDIPAKFIVALISIEDKKFYQHNGVDVKSLLRAAKAMLENGKVTQGGSTITMQLAKIMFMEPGRTWQYKVEQIFIATELEKKYSKSDILEFYLNNIYFANGYYGIDAACHGYFNCELNELDASEIAFLMAIPNSPSYYDPLVNYDHTIERRNRILDNMREDGKLSEEEYQQALAEKVTLRVAKKTANQWNNYVDTYAYHCATKAMMENEGFVFRYYFSDEDEKNEYEMEYEEMYETCQKRLYTGGYHIYTSIDMRKQVQLQDAINVELSDFTSTNEEGVYEMQGAAVTVDNETGLVVAIVGGREQNFGMYTLNRAYQSHRQPGSSIKPLIVYTPALERGYTPDSVVTDQEIEDGPKNAGGSYAGDVALWYAVAKSMNTVAWQLYDELTPQVGLSYLKEMNFSEIVDNDYVLATSLGGFTRGVSPLEMAAGYATIQNDGCYRTPTCIMKIIDADNNVVYDRLPLDQVVYKENACRMMTSCLEQAMLMGTGQSAALSFMPCAGKTGTTNDQKDGWFVGYTRYYTTSVWVGYDMPREVPDLKGNTYPARIWNRYMEQVHIGKVPLGFLPYPQMSDQWTQNGGQGADAIVEQEPGEMPEGIEVPEAEQGQEEVADPDNVPEPGGPQEEIP